MLKTMFFRKLTAGLLLLAIAVHGDSVAFQVQGAAGELQFPGVPLTTGEAQELVRKFTGEATVYNARARLSEAYGKLPLSFEANQGQTDSRVKFLSRGSGYSLFLTADEAVMMLTRQNAKGKSQDRQNSPATANPLITDVLRINLVGVNPAPPVSGIDQIPAKSNYFIGNDPKKWRTNVPHYAKVQYSDIYPGVDIVYYGNQRQLEYDFVLAPGADPGAIILGFQGADRLEIDARGDLVIQTKGGQIRQRKPLVYQEVSGLKRAISAHYVLKPSHRVGFQVAAYDASRPLIIDPVLVYSTYLGGSGTSDEGKDIAVDGTGHVYVTGRTNSADFPTTGAAFDTSFNGGSHGAYVTKLDPTGTALVFSTYLGGSGNDDANGIAVDASGDVYLAGATSSTDFPTMNAFDTTLGGDADAFVTKLNASGSTLLYSTYFGGTVGFVSGIFGVDTASDLALDAADRVYITGVTTSTDYPVTPGAFQIANTDFGEDSHVAVFDPSMSGAASLVAATYLGGPGGVDRAASIAVDAAGDAYIAGRTDSLSFPTTPTAFQTGPQGGGPPGPTLDAFVTRLSFVGSASSLVYSTYLGGSGIDLAHGIAVDAAGHAYVTGDTRSSNFPLSTGPLDGTLGGFSDAFVTRLDTTASGAASLIYSTYLGGSLGGSTAVGQDFGLGIALSGPDVAVAGVTRSTNFPLAGAFQSTHGGGPLGAELDAFVSRLSPVPSGALSFSSYLGGNGDDRGFDVAVDAAGSIYVTGFTGSTNLPTTTGAFDTTPNGGLDAFVANIVPPPRVEAAPTNPAVAIPCTLSACKVRMLCSGVISIPPQGGVVPIRIRLTPCANRIRLFVRGRLTLRAAAARLSGDGLAKAPRRMIRFASGVANIPPAQTATVRLPLTKRGRDIVKIKRGKRLRGVLEITNVAGSAVTNTPIRTRPR